jgi:type IV pilus assembly protein PilY1
VSAARTLLALLAAFPCVTALAAEECAEAVFVPPARTVYYEPHGARQRTIVFTPDPAGVLKAMEAGTGATLWEYAPAGLDTTHRAEGLMSGIAVLRVDANRDGSIDASEGDKVWLYFGLRRGGRRLLALDATDPARPELLWEKGGAELPAIGEIWSAPTVARAHVAGSPQSPEHWVVLIGGGYDGASSTAGHRVFMLDAASGDLLWYAGGPGGTETPVTPALALPSMTAAITGGVTALDMDGDRYVDRLYLADIGGRVWRFDLWNGKSASQFATGGIFASLGAAAASTAQDARRFFNAPDVALVFRRGLAPYLNIALGSGDRAHPWNADVHERFYSLRDRNPHARLTQEEYDAIIPLKDEDLTDVTGHASDAMVPLASRGWKLELRLHGGWEGEKVLADSLTVEGTLLFTTFQPRLAADCTKGGINRVYALNLDQASTPLDLDQDGAITDTDVSRELEQSGIAGGVALTRPSSPRDGEGSGEGDSPFGARCTVGGEILAACVFPRALKRTFWQRDPPR